LNNLTSLKNTEMITESKQFTVPTFSMSGSTAEQAAARSVFPPAVSAALTYQLQLLRPALNKPLGSLIKLDA
jgi:hypothetical protein